MVKTEEQNSLLRAPNHVGIILDGNGRWAKRQGKKRTDGHRVGSENVVTITKACQRLGVQALSLYAFSTENWKRSDEEVSTIMKLLVQFVDNYIQELHENNVKLVTMGDLARLPVADRIAIGYAKRKTAKNTGMILNIGLNYGGRDEIVRSVKELASDVAKGLIRVDDIDEAAIRSHMDTASLPDPDLIIRTGGEQRISNFMIYQAAYAEFYFTPVLWPDFSEQDLLEAFENYFARDRRYGGVK